MALRVLDTILEERLIEERRRMGGDRYDEVWDGEYVMSPLANLEHQHIASRLATIFYEVLGARDDVWSLAGANVSDQEVEWTKNYRCPDVVVTLPGSRAQNRHTHWYGGPDLVVEIVSEGDASYDKLDFYSKIGVREVLIVNRDPWLLELYRPNDAGVLTLVGRVDLLSSGHTASEVLDAELSLVQRDSRVSIKVIQTATGRSWET
jgi:Uma2 family endonuclease